jgi:hypothetical protein
MEVIIVARASSPVDVQSMEAQLVRAVVRGINFTFAPRPVFREESGGEARWVERDGVV